MNPYILLTSDIDTADARELRTRLTSWHDEMVRHERRLQREQARESCDDECAHADARLLWAEAQLVFGRRAGRLTYLHTCASAPEAAIAEAT